MGDHHVVCVDKLIAADTLQSGKGTEVSELCGDSHVNVAESSNSHQHQVVEEDGVPDEEKPLIQVLECRICQEEDTVKNLEAPCSCSGSLKYAHRKCVQKWCNEKGDVICEICNQTYQPAYTVPPHRPNTDATIDLSAQWPSSVGPFDLNDSRFLAMAAAERHLLEAEYDEYGDTNANGAAFCRSAALILMALLLLRHAIYVTSADGEEDDISTFFSLFLLRAAGFLLPCYIMAWAISILQRRRQSQEAAAVASGEVAYVIQAGENGGMQVTIGSGSAVDNNPEPHQ